MRQGSYTLVLFIPLPEHAVEHPHRTPENLFGLPTVKFDLTQVMVLTINRPETQSGVEILIDQRVPRP